MTIDVLSIVPIEELRQHVEMDTDDRDAVIKRYAQSALDYCLRWCDDPRWKQASDIPSPVVSAMLLVFGDLFEHRTSQTEVQLYTNVAAENLMFSCRNWRGIAEQEEGS
ncbi:head-tail connector protein [Salmonella enterica]|uniref:head-tail connector protein n=1 Tax=Enterobacteriaceae TaxID=543 RepID=UPI002A3BC882|nr:head-tail connector protein [Citrobacter sp. R-1.5.2]MDJ5953915.1 head-tail connector protein [Salmonella enterica]MEB2420313.1 head-tail connector protein [Citrobacter sp. R-1.5.2]HBM0283745.1 phage head-tail connector protein [Salmonella enterica]